MEKDWLNSEIQILKNNAKILVFQFNQTNTLVLYSDKTKRMGLQDSVVLYKSYDFYFYFFYIQLHLSLKLNIF